MGAGVPAIVQNLVWSIVSTAVFVLGGVAFIITVHKTVMSYKDSNDSWSSRTVMTLVVGGAITAACWFGGVFGMVKLMNSVNQGYGLASGQAAATDLNRFGGDTPTAHKPAGLNRVQPCPHTVVSVAARRLA